MLADSAKPQTDPFKWRGIMLIVAVIFILATVGAAILLFGAEIEVTGIVLDAEGQPITGAVVSPGTGAATTGPDGRHSLKVFGIGSVVLMASSEGH